MAIGRAPLLRQIDELISNPTTPQFTLLVAEIDRFALLTQTLGREACGELVRGLGNRVLLSVAPPDTAVYLGCGRFAWLTEDDNSAAIERHLRQCAALPVEIEGRPIYVSLRIGLVRGGDYARAEDVVRDAVIAAGRASETEAPTVFESRMRLRPLEDLRLEMDLRRALAENALRIEYQPIVELDSAALVGFETLVRWTGAEGPVSPARFIPLAERTGLVVGIGRWVMAGAARQLMQWSQEYAQARDVVMSVNVSARQLTPGLPCEIATLLRETGLPPGQLKLEFTETAIANDPRVADVLEACRELGVEVWLDDFGTGFSSLAYLQRFPINGIKLDKSFVDPLDGSCKSAAMARAIRQIADAIGVEAVAEGIETPTQREQLCALGYRLGQGYLFSPPMPADDAGRWLAGEGWLRRLG